MVSLCFTEDHLKWKSRMDPTWVEIDYVWWSLGFYSEITQISCLSGK